MEQGRHGGVFPSRLAQAVTRKNYHYPFLQVTTNANCLFQSVSCVTVTPLTSQSLRKVQPITLICVCQSTISPLQVSSVMLLSLCSTCGNNNTTMNCPTLFAAPLPLTSFAGPSCAPRSQTLTLMTATPNYNVISHSSTTVNRGSKKKVHLIYQCQICLLFCVAGIVYCVFNHSNSKLCVARRAHFYH